jgi:transglutaminase-like putative cysteine protease
MREYLDLNGNLVQYFEIPEPHLKLAIEARSTVDTVKRVDFDKFPYGTTMDKLRDIEKNFNCRNYLQSSNYVEITPTVWKEAVDVRGNSNDVFQTAYQIMEFIYLNYEYSNSTTTVDTLSSSIIKKRKGVCQDFAHVAIAMCRSLGIPARYVSGYFFDHTRNRSMRGSEASHAWIEVLINGHGWYGLDPTNNRVVDETYIILGSGRDYRDVAPITGTYFGRLPTSMDVDVSVKKLGN